ncbi:hypothetical protein MA16_Dca013815 [Dendrobium catenatum]|uniref:Uncharacterized protein n=1 Tax=Dendrobium catenatum TaxID=906689 RepID=A0A2I0W8F1_9ASPA|nr:hypothetical protein MA16_Dca013815 [Dendrobium catenatum]
MLVHRPFVHVFVSAIATRELFEVRLFASSSQAMQPMLFHYPSIRVFVGAVASYSKFVSLHHLPNLHLRRLPSRQRILFPAG